MEANDFLTTKQQKEIVNAIIDRCRRYKSLEEQFDSLFYKPYTKMREKHLLTSAVLSAFSPMELSIDGIKSNDIYYGLNNNLSQPELICDRGIFHIYSDGSNLKGNRITELSAKYNEDTMHTPVFFIIVFTADNSCNLTKVELCALDKNGSITERIMIYESVNSLAVIA